MDAGVILNLTLPDEISVSKVASSVDVPCNTVPNCECDAVVPS